MNSTGLVAWQR